MAIQEANLVIQALQNALSGMENRARYAQEQGNLEKERQFRQTQFEAQQQQQQVQNEAASKMFDLRKAENDRAQAQFEAEQALKSAQTGIMPSDAKVLPAVQPTQDQPLVHSDLQENKLIFPSGNVVNAPTPEAYAEQQGRMQEIINRPTVAAKRQEKAAESQERIALERIRQEEETKRFIKQIQTSKEYDLEKSGRELEGRKAIEGMMVQERIRTAMINATGGLSEMMGGGTFGKGTGMGQGGVSITTGKDGQPEFKSQNLPGVINQGLNNLYYGNTSLEQLEKTNPKIKQMMSTLAGTYNIGSLSEKDRTEMHDLKLMIPAASILKELHDLRMQYPNEIYIPGTNAYKAFNSAAQRLDTEIPRITKAQSGVQRQSEPELRRFFDGLVPSRNPITSSGKTEASKYNDFITNKMWGHVKSLLEGLPENQKNAILKTHGFTELPGLIVEQPTTTSGQEVVHKRDANGRLQ